MIDEKRKEIEVAISVFYHYTQKQHDQDRANIIKYIAAAYDFDLDADRKKHLLFLDCSNDEEIDEVLQLIMEKISGRKTKEPYYTPHDVIRFMLVHLSKDDDQFLSKTFFDPTCGAGDFLLEILDLKLLGKIEPRTALATTYGNDIDPNAVLVTKLRLLIDLYQRDLFTPEMVTIVNQNIACCDFANKTHFQSFDVVMGNPPFASTRRLKKRPDDYGNLYTNVLLNVQDCLKKNGKMAFIVPLSFSSSKFMQKVRCSVFCNFAQNEVMSYADQPDSLFEEARQKVNLVFGFGFNSGNGYLLNTSSYLYWTRGERYIVVNTPNMCSDPYTDLPFLPKIGNIMEKNIFKKITQNSGTPISKMLVKNNGENTLYLSKRVAFYVKCFLEKPDEKQYKEFSCSKLPNKTMLAILSSSLFWMYWVLTSDGKHITKTILQYFKVPDLSDEVIKQLSDLADELLAELKKTKHYIGKKQKRCKYDYSTCFDVLNKIDDVLADVYKLKPDEASAVKNYNKVYRGEYEE